jgi:pimeloyl-ACP methyl ester carboxylesterase
MPAPIESPTLDIEGAALEAVHVPATSGAPTLVFLHEALGALALWRDFPQRLAAATGLGFAAYSRRGHGRSSALGASRDTAYLDREAIDVLPAVLERLGIARPILYGHSDGATIALIHAAGAGQPVEAVIAEAPHVFVEQMSLDGIRATMARAAAGDLLVRLGKYHDRPEAIFEAWHSIWLSPEFRDWSIVHRLPAIVAPILAIQGRDDPYGSLAHIDAIVAGSGARVETLLLDGIGHAPYAEAPDMVIAAVRDFIGAL